MKTSHLANLTGLTVRRINQLIAEKILPATKDGSFPDEAEALSAMFTYFRGQRQSSARLRYETALADLTELKLSREKKLVVPLAEVERVWADVVLNVRQKVLQLPPRIGSQLSDSNAQRITEEITREILKELALDLGNMATDEEAREQAEK